MVKERYVLYEKLNKYMRANCPVFVPRATTSAIRKNVNKNKKIMDRFHHVYRRELRDFAKTDKKWDEVSEKFLNIIRNMNIQLQANDTIRMTQRLPTMPNV